MTSVKTSITIEAPAERVWNTVRAFGNIDQYVAAIERSESEGSGVGMTRRLTLQDGGRVTERLEALHDEGRTLTYTIVESPLPINNYVSTITVEHVEEQRCRVTWECGFDPDGVPAEAVTPDLEALYRSGLNGLQSHHQ
jgi:hypothetical protein